MTPDYISPDVNAAFDRKLADLERRHRRLNRVVAILILLNDCLALWFLWRITHA